jgi:hypothetical protein
MQRRRNRNSAQELFGIKGFTDFGLDTAGGELVFFQVAPANLSVLSPERVAAKTQDLLQLLSAVPELEILVTDSCESFDQNRLFLKRKREEESNPKVRDILEQDLDFLDRTQSQMASARQFLFCIRMKNASREQVFTQANRMEKQISGQGFAVRRLDRGGLKRLMALYFGASLSGERMGDFDGQTWLNDLPNEAISRLELKSFFDLVLPATVKFLPDYYHCGDRYCSAWALKDYPPGTEEQALLAQVAVRPGVTLRCCNRLVDAMD